MKNNQLKENELPVWKYDDDEVILLSQEQSSSFAESSRAEDSAKADGDPYGIRIRITTVKGWCPNR